MRKRVWVRTRSTFTHLPPHKRSIHIKRGSWGLQSYVKHTEMREEDPFRIPCEISYGSSWLFMGPRESSCERYTDLYGGPVGDYEEDQDRGFHRLYNH